MWLDDHCALLIFIIHVSVWSIRFAVTNTLQPRYNAPRYNAVSVITLSRDGPQFLATKMHYN